MPAWVSTPPVMTCVPSTMVIAVPFVVEGWHVPAGRRTREPRPLAQAGQIRPAAPVGARNWDPAGKPVAGQPQRRRPDRESGRVPGSDVTPVPSQNPGSRAARRTPPLILPGGYRLSRSGVRSWGVVSWPTLGSGLACHHFRRRHRCRFSRFPAARSWPNFRYTVSEAATCTKLGSGDAEPTRLWRPWRSSRCRRSILPRRRLG